MSLSIYKPVVFVGLALSSDSSDSDRSLLLFSQGVLKKVMCFCSIVGTHDFRPGF